MRKIGIVNIIISSLLVLNVAGCNKDDSAWIWKIDGEKVTINDLENAYNNYLFLTAQQMRMTVDQLKEVIADPSMIDEPQTKQYLKSLTLKNYADTYKQLLLLNKKAEADGYTKKQDIKDKIEFFQKFYIASLYMNETLEAEKVEISDQEALEAWEVIRKSNPQYARVPIDEGLYATKQQLKMQKTMEKQQEMVRNIVESYTIESNSEFKLSEYIENKKSSAKSEDKKEAGINDGDSK